MRTICGILSDVSDAPFETTVISKVAVPHRRFAITIKGASLTRIVTRRLDLLERAKRFIGQPVTLVMSSREQLLSIRPG